MGIRIVEPRLLLVEGKDDEKFFGALIRHLEIPNVQIIRIGSGREARKHLKAVKDTSGFHKVRSLGIVRDADNYPDRAFQSICDALDYAGLPVPDEPITPVGNNPCLAVLILPGADKPGALEDLCLQAVRGDPAMHCVNQYFKCLEGKGFSLPRNMSKAKVQVFLASKPKALRLGEAAEAGFWPWDAKSFEHVKDFLQKLFT